MIINTGGRTDTVHYYSQWLLERFSQGYVYARNPLYPEKVTKYSLIPEVVDCVVFCSKNYEPILPRLEEITSRFNTYFFYTITAYGKDIEENIPDIDKSIDTLIKLEKIAGKQRIMWRYDPVFLTKKYTVQQHFITFEHMAARLTNHVSGCLFSFVELYKKLETNFPELQVPDDEQKHILARGFGKIAAKYRIPLKTCATKEDFSEYGISPSGCVTLDIIGKANDIEFRNLKHSGMRKNCTCIKSNDIGAYNTCPGGCRYCYANEDHQKAKENFAIHNVHSPVLCSTLNVNDIITDSRQKTFQKDPPLQLMLF